MIAGIFIRNFKNYEKINFIPFLTSENDKISIFAGENGAGKSAILESMHCLMNNVDSKEWPYTIGQNKDRVAIFPLFLFEKKEWDAEVIQTERISNIFWQNDFTESLNNDSVKKFISYREKIKEWYSPEEHYLIAIGKDFDGNILLTSTLHTKICNITRTHGVSREKIINIFKKILDRYKFVYLPVENKISDVLSLQANEMQGMMDKSVSDEIRGLLSSKEFTVDSEHTLYNARRPKNKLSLMDLVNSKLDQYIDELNNKIPHGYKFESKGAIKRSIKPSDILEPIFLKYFTLRPLSKNSKNIKSLSSGEQRIALIDIATTLLSTSEKKNKEVILAIDEPEISLEASHRFEQFSSLVDLSENYKRQVFITTHWYGLILRPIMGTLHYVNKEKTTDKIDSFPLQNIQESRRAFPNSIEIRSYFDLMASLLTLIKKSNYNWIFCEGSEDYNYLKSYLKDEIENLFILPFNGCGNVKKIFDFLHVPFSDTQENKDIKGKVLCLIDNDTKNNIRCEDYSEGKYKGKLAFYRLIIENDESNLLSVASTNAINTEIEDLLIPELFFDSLNEISKKDKKMEEYLKLYSFDTSKKFTNLSDNLSFLIKKEKESYEKSKEFYDYLTTNKMKSLISEKYNSDPSKVIPRPEDTWINNIIKFFNPIEKPKK